MLLRPGIHFLHFPSLFLVPFSCFFLFLSNNTRSLQSNFPPLLKKNKQGKSRNREAGSSINRPKKDKQTKQKPTLFPPAYFPAPTPMHLAIPYHIIAKIVLIQRIILRIADDRLARACSVKATLDMPTNRNAFSLY